MLAWLIIPAAVAAVLVVLYGIANKVFNVAVKSAVSKGKVLRTNTGDAKNADRSLEMQNRTWLAEQTFDERTIMAADGTVLYGRVLYASVPTNAWVVICHGFSGNGLKMGSAARHFHSAGCHVLLPDLRGCGNSGSRYLGMGWLDSQDIPLWFDMLRTITPDARIVLAGGSMGGAAVMMTAGLDPHGLVAAIEDCGYTSVWEEFTYQLKKVFGLPQFPFMYMVDGMAKRRAGYSFREADSRVRLARCRTPMLFIHGTEDAFVPFYMLRQNYDAATHCACQMLVVENAGHGVSADIAPELYWGTVDAFLEKHVPGFLPEDNI